jgi:ADP-ribose pyrophosphatase
VATFTIKDRVDSKKIYQGSIIDLRVDRLKVDNIELIREVIEHNGGVVIAAQPEPDKVILIRQYRYSIDMDLLELPAGRIEKNEIPLPAAKRELKEETGFEAENWEDLSAMYSAPGFCNEVLYLYKATNLNFTGKQLDIDEETEVLIVSLDQAWQMVRQGEIRDAKSIAGIGMISR